MNRIVLAFTIPWIIFSTASTVSAQGRGGSREAKPEVAAEQAQPKAPEASPQQNPPPRRGNDEPRPQYKPVVLQLQNADCVEAAEMLNRIFFKGTVVPVPRTNSIVYAGPEDSLPQVMDLLEKVDLPSTEGDAAELAMIPLRHRRVEEIADQVMKVLSVRNARDVRIASDKGRSMLLIRGPKSVAQMAQSVVEALDKPAGSVNLEFAFFHADLNRKEALGTLPADLARVAEELRRFGAIELMGRLSTIAVEGDDFMVGGSVAESISEIQVHGELASATPEGAVRLKLRTWLTLDRPSASPPPAETGQAKDKNEDKDKDKDKGKDKDKEKGKTASRSGPRPSYQLETTVFTKRGDYVVLGGAPTGWAPGESVIVVVRVIP